MKMERLTGLSTALLVLGALSLAGIGFARSSPVKGKVLASEAIVREKAAVPLSSEVEAFLVGRDSIRATVWLFFSDKGFRNNTGFERSAAGVTLTERAARRRSKVGINRPVFADLPVSQAYIERVVALGATHRRSSRWLNAASFDMPHDLLPSVGDLPFVAKIEPVARGTRPEPVNHGRSGPEIGGVQSSEDLNYGPSRAQISQINAITAHMQGYSGRGVTLAIMDTGFRKTHEALIAHTSAGRVLAEYDFVMNDSNTSAEPDDVFGQVNHGTTVWSVAGGNAPGRIIGPAFGADFILCKTEDLGSETPVEEDNWVAALEFADSVGADVITTSLNYYDWYDFEDLDGQTAVISQAASMCDGLGIVMVCAVGNGGPDPATLRAPADAFDILAVGGVDAAGTIVPFSSRGPTFDRRRKPEVCALGADVYGADGYDEVSYRYGGGTSFAAPLVAGAACLLIEARPELTPAMIREALKTTAGRAAHPDYTYGFGLIDLGAALTWPVAFAPAATAGQVPLAVDFVNLSWLTSASVEWDFGDGTGSTEQAPGHVYATPGVYDVTLTILTEMGTFFRTEPDLISAHADTLQVPDVVGIAGQSNRVDVYARNYLPLIEIEIPFSWAGELDINLDSFSTAGLRTEYFGTQSVTSVDFVGKRATVFLRSAGTIAEPGLDPGYGPVVSLYFDLPLQPGPGENPVEFVAYGSYSPTFLSGTYGYQPAIRSGSLRLGCCLGRVGDVDGANGDEPNLADISRLIDHLFINKAPLGCYPEADANRSGGADPGPEDVTISDIAFLLDYLFISQASLVLPDCP